MNFLNHIRRQESYFSSLNKIAKYDFIRIVIKVKTYYFAFINRVIFIFDFNDYLLLFYDIEISNNEIKRKIIIFLNNQLRRLLNEATQEIGS